ncbi:hypothetical protein AVEN_3750-1 [Araneus ventricosus]|uniref:Uncharacterized protein n=1 Tax=Araneus ventricosus TaxID=182803 RepID=A0A4Y2RJV9_ARAVE|nr:hypothetical protein AVEN_3750-1 [Araneus ventricosus]
MSAYVAISPILGVNFSARCVRCPPGVRGVLPSVTPKGQCRRCGNTLLNCSFRLQWNLRRIAWGEEVQRTHVRSQHRQTRGIHPGPTTEGAAGRGRRVLPSALQLLHLAILLRNWEEISPARPIFDWFSSAFVS